MEPKFLKMLLLFLISCFLYVYFLSRGRKRYSGRLPPGSLGLPLIGQTFDFLKALKDDKVQEWFQKRIAKHGPIFKANLLGHPTVVLHGVTANKLLYTSDGILLINKNPSSVTGMLGTNNILELMGGDHKRVRGALLSFLKLDVLKQFVAKIDEEILHHLETHWRGKNKIKVQPVIKTLTFDVTCSLLIGIERGSKRERLLPLFQDLIESLLAIPVNLPFTQYGHGLKTRKKLVTMLLDVIREKKEALREQKQQANPHKDLIVSLLQSNDDDSSTTMSDEEIVDNLIAVMVAGYDTTSVLLTLLIRLLANDESIYNNVAQEQEEISKSKASGKALTWEDLTKMKYTWRVASETLRMYPPVTLTFRRAAQEIEYGGYIIPKGWQVMISASLTHNDDSIFQNPAVFDPARFEKHAPSPPPFSFVPFGAGPRLCPGIELAKMETLSMIHRLVTLFKWELLNNDESFKRLPFPEFDQGLEVGLRPIEKNISK